MASNKSSKKIASKKKPAAKKKAAAKKDKPAADKAAVKKAPRKYKKRKNGKKKSEHYVDGKLFYEQICEYYKTGILPDVLSISVLKIANGLSFAPNFINYSYKDEMVGDAILKMFSALKNRKFNVDATNNPFSYFTTIAFHAFINRIKKEKKHRETITKYQETVYGDMMNEDKNNSSTYTDSTSTDTQSYD
jgi:hypothetical protein|tara:strand:+ start:399 stop:971 length:573 start_codon:yes stop_codon:yes gene_type:complete